MKPESVGQNAAAHSVMLVIDQRLAMRFGSRSKAKSVVAAEIAAFIAWRALAQNARVGALVFNDKKADLLWPNCTRLSVMLILHSMLNQNHALSRCGKSSFNSVMLNRALHRIERFAATDCAIYVITDASGYNEETFQLLANLSKKSQLHLILVYDPRQKKFGKTRWLLSKRFTRKLQRQINRNGSTSFSGDNQPQTGITPPAVGRIPVIQFSTWESATTQLRRASRKSILPPQVRPVQSRRRCLHVSDILPEDPNLKNRENTGNPTGDAPIQDK